MSYTGVDYQSVEVNPLTKAELKPWSGDYKKVPIAIIDEKQINGSDEIIQSILSHPKVSSSLTNKWTVSSSSTEKQSTENDSMTMDKFMSSKEAIQWSTFATDDLAPILYPNICRSISESYQAFGYVQHVESFSSIQKFLVRNIGSFAMSMAASKIKSKRNITDEREAIHEAISTWEKEGLDDGMKMYCSGNVVPNLGDIAVFGVLHSIDGLDTHDEIVKRRGGTVQEWYERILADVYAKA